MYNRRNEARIEKMQQRLDAGFVSKHFPEVTSIVINMLYNQRGIAKPIHRIINFFPDSYAFFRIDCLMRDCVDGGFDLNQVIDAMIRNHRETARGELCCESNGSSAVHSDIVYEVVIQYA